MANKPQTNSALLANNRERLVASMIRARSKKDRDYIQKQIENFDRMAAMAQNPGSVTDLAAPPEGTKSTISVTPEGGAKIHITGKSAPAQTPSGPQLRTAPAQMAPTPSAQGEAAPEAVAQGAPNLEGVPSPEAAALSRYQDKLAQPAVIPTNDEIPIGLRTSLAFAGGANPEFLQAVVGPILKERLQQTSASGKLALAADAERIKATQLDEQAGIAPLLNLARQRELTEQELHSGFSHLAEEFFGPGGQGGGKIDTLKDLATQLQASKRPDLMARGKQMLGHAALMSGLMFADNEIRQKHGLPPQKVGPADLATFDQYSKEADKLLNDAYNDLDMAERTRTVQEMMNNRLMSMRKMPGNQEINEHTDMVIGAQEINKLESLVKNGALGVADLKTAQLMAKYHITGPQVDQFKRDNLEARVLRGHMNLLMAHPLLGSAISTGEKQIAGGFLLDDDSSEAEVLSAINMIRPYVTTKLAEMDSRWNFTSNINGPTPQNMSPAAIESGYIPDEMILQLLQEGR